MTAEELAALRKRWLKGEHGVELIHLPTSTQLAEDALALFQHVEQLEAENAALRTTAQNLNDLLVVVRDNFPEVFATIGEALAELEGA